MIAIDTNVLLPPGFVRQTERGQFSYDYDDLNRLLTSSVSGTALNDSEGFDYDGVGNRTSYQHNGNPSLVGWVEHGDTQQVAPRKFDSVLGGWIMLGFGTQPNLRKTVGGVTTYFLYNHQGMVGEYDASGALLKEYHYTPDSTWMTDPLFQRDGGQVYFYQNDHLGTPQRLLNPTGAIVWQADYRAFGQATVNTALVSNNLRFPGQYFDAETGLHHNYFRDYDPGLGRYVQGDPIGVSGGLNIYSYAELSPLTMIDPAGLSVLQDGDGKYHTHDRKEHLPLPKPVKDKCLFSFMGVGFLCDPPKCADVSPNYQSCHVCCATTAQGISSDCYIRCSRQHKDPTNPLPELGCGPKEKNRT